MNLLKNILEFLKDKNNGNSYKRLTGFGCFVTAIVLAFANKDYMLVGMFLSVAMGNSITTLFEKKD